MPTLFFLLTSPLCLEAINNIIKIKKLIITVQDKTDIPQHFASICDNTNISVLLSGCLSTEEKQTKLCSLSVVPYNSAITDK
uniref:Putative secreted protein n=1 Tax=Amblyomma triste TaxID=251400 RepID=A0A023G3M2_AMBTT